MNISAPPIVRCTRVIELPSGALMRCHGWLVARAMDPLELPPGQAFCCLDCSEDYEIIAGALVAITRPAGAPLPTVRLPLPPVSPAVRGRPRKERVTA